MKNETNRPVGTTVPQDERRGPSSPGQSPEKAPGQQEHEGARGDQVDDRRGPGVGYDQEPEKVRDQGGVTT